MALASLFKRTTQHGRLVQIEQTIKSDDSDTDAATTVFNTASDVDLTLAKLESVSGTRVRYATISCTASTAAPNPGGWHLYYSPTAAGVDKPIVGTAHKRATSSMEHLFKMPAPKHGSVNGNVNLDYIASVSAGGADGADQATIIIVVEVY